MIQSFDMNGVIGILIEGAIIFVAGAIVCLFFFAFIWAWNKYSNSWRHHPIWGMEPMTPQPFNRTSFITLNSNRLFTAKEVANLIKEYTPSPAPSASTDEQCRICSDAIRKDEREKVLDELLQRVCNEEQFFAMGPNNEEIYHMTGQHIRKVVESLRSEVPE